MPSSRYACVGCGCCPDARTYVQVFLSLFLQNTNECGKLVVFDEAHKYMDESATGLGADIVSAARQMRHKNLRIVVSSQNPAVRGLMCCAVLCSVLICAAGAAR